MSELDSALARLHLCGFEYAEAVPNYGPMAVAALEHLGHASLTVGLLDIYCPRLPEIAEGRVLDVDARRGALGDMERAADWVASFEADLAARAWSQVLDEAMAARCAEPGAPGLSPHAIARLGHAVRGLEGKENPTRVRELAFALAYVFSRVVPARQDVPDAAEWIARVNDTGGAAFAPLLSKIALAGAARYLACPKQRAELAPGVVAPTSFRALLPHLAPETARRALISLLIGLGAALPAQVHSSQSDELEDPEVARCAEDPREIRYRAACSVQEHAIVMAEACLREDEVAPNPTLRRAAADAALRLSPPGYREWR